MDCGCGSSSASPQLLSEDADKRAIDDLTKQAKTQSGPLAALTRARRDQIRAEVAAETGFARSINRSRRELLAVLEAAAARDPQLLLRLSPDELNELILNSSMGQAVDDLILSQQRILQSIESSLAAIDPSLSIQDLPQLEQLQLQSVASIFEDVILPDTQSAVRDALTSLSLEVPAEIVFSDLNERLRRSTGRQLTEVKTRISQYGRGINAAAAAAAELDLYLYTGPMDGITRPFCKPLVNKVVSQKQMSALSNGQGLPVITSGGGYNCRHSWSPVSQSFVDAAELERATRSDIAQANRRGRQR